MFLCACVCVGVDVDVGVCGEFPRKQFLILLFLFCKFFSLYPVALLLDMHVFYLLTCLY